MDRDALRGSGYIGQARPQDTTLCFEFGLCDLCLWCQLKMVKSRKPLGSLACLMNVGGEEAVRRRVGPERTAMECQTRGMNQRGEQTWRPLTRQRVVAFCELILRCMVWTENGEREGRPHPEVVEALLGTLVRRIIPWVDQHHVWSNFERRWPMTLEHFKEMDNDLCTYLPSVHAGQQWQRIRVYFADTERVREQRRLEEQERRQRAIRLNQVRRVLQL